MRLMIAGILLTAVSSPLLLSAMPIAEFDPTAEATKFVAKLKVRPNDCPQWGISPMRNNTPAGKNIAKEWNVETGKNILWSSPLGSQTYGNPVIANGKVYVGTNNHHSYLKRYPKTVDLGCLICFDEKDGKFLWQHSSEKLPTGRVHDWPDQGICCAPFIDGERGWFVSSRGLVICFDTEGFLDGENDGPFKSEPNENKDEGDVIWQLDMMGKLGISQHNMCSCSVTVVDDIVYVVTGNGVDEGHLNLPSPNAPSFIAVDKNTGELLWQDSSPGTNVLHGQWSSPAVAELGGVMQVLMPAGDGWLYSFKHGRGVDGKGELLWKFDCNPKMSKYVLGGRADRNHLIGTPVVYDGKVFVAVGEDPEHGEGYGHLWCIDPTKRGDVSPELVFNKADLNTPISHKRIQAAEPDKGDVTKDNPNSAVIWHYGANFKGPLEEPQGDPDQIFHRTIGSTAIKNDLLFIIDFSGIVHCLNAKTGEKIWTHDMLAASWGTPLIVDNTVYVGDEDGGVTIFELSKEKKVIGKMEMGSAVYTSPVIANDTLYIANRDRIFAIKPGAQSKPASEEAKQ